MTKFAALVVLVVPLALQGCFGTSKKPDGPTTTASGCQNGLCVGNAQSIFSNDKKKAQSYCSQVWDPDATCLEWAVDIYSGNLDKAKAYCQFTWDPKAECLWTTSNALLELFGPSKIAQAAQYCTKAWDPNLDCLRYATISYGGQTRVNLAADYCVKATDPACACLKKANSAVWDIVGGYSNDMAAAYCIDLSERRYADDGKLYSESEFVSWFSMRPKMCVNGHEQWEKAPLEKRIAEDGKPYTAKEFEQWFTSQKVSLSDLKKKWDAARVAPKPAVQAIVRAHK